MVMTDNDLLNAKRIDLELRAIARYLLDKVNNGTKYEQGPARAAFAECAPKSVTAWLEMSAFHTE